ncbi:MAG TPA: AsmA-like C-terminal region-containing protein [Candidatus Acidoferrales bacterium]|nr:AsmA-like C-terminal region-containing protein [Candidatus Acidoferrales bacterium]
MADRQLSIVRDSVVPLPPQPAPPEPALEIVPEPPLARPNRVRRWLKWVFLLFVCLWLLDATASVLIRYTALQKRVTARLSAAFGRPVEVGHYNFSLWTGPVLEAQSITVGEDPRFGSEYFVHADSLTIRLRWQSLIRGHLGLGTLSFSGPSLNVVRNSAGDWNLAEWLPRPNQAGSGAVPGTNSTSGQRQNSFALGANGTSAQAPRFERIELDGGRINFKLADEKLPFAFINVAGTVNAESGGRWRIDLVATPWRVAALTQQAGEIHVAGRVGGTSSRLLPATFDATWTDTSVSDALRLARGDDFGIRGNLAVAVSAQSTNGEWEMRSRAELRQVHRWNLALRPDNPDLNFLGQIRFDPRTSDFELTSGTLEAPHSNATVSGRFSWQDESEKSGASKFSAARLEIANSAIDLQDALAWLRAFHAGVLDRIGIQGEASVAGSVSGWPPHVQSVSLASDGADLSGVGIRVPLHLGNIDLQYDAEHFSLAPLTASLGARKSQPVGTFRVDATYKPKVNRPPMVRLAGSAAHAADLTAVAGALGWNLARGWAVDGPFHCDLRWQGMEPWRTEPAGTIELGGELGGAGEADGASLRAPFLNLPIEQLRTRAEIKPGSRHVVVSSASAFGAHWAGTFDWRDLDRQWHFALAADRLTTPDLDRWLNPRWRETFIDRMLPFLNSRFGARATPDMLRADGSLKVGEFAVGALQLHDVQGALSVGGRNVEFSDASARFYGGNVDGSLTANLSASPAYRVATNFDGVDLAALGGVSPSLDGLFGGTASGEISFSMRGGTRSDLISSMECEGSAKVTDAEVPPMNFGNARQETAANSSFSRGAAAFSCANGKIQMRDLSLTGASQEIAGMGTVDFGHNLNLRLRVSEPASGMGTDWGLSTAWYQLGGTLASPLVSRVPVPTKRGR